MGHSIAARTRLFVDELGATGIAAVSIQYFSRHDFHSYYESNYVGNESIEGCAQRNAHVDQLGVIANWISVMPRAYSPDRESHKIGGL